MTYNLFINVSACTISWQIATADATVTWWHCCLYTRLERPIVCILVTKEERRSLDTLTRTCSHTHTHTQYIQHTHAHDKYLHGNTHSYTGCIRKMAPSFSNMYTHRIHSLWITKISQKINLNLRLTNVEFTFTNNSEFEIIIIINIIGYV